MLLMDKDVVLTTREAIEYLKISKPTFLKYIHLGRIKGSKRETGGEYTDPNYIDF